MRNLIDQNIFSPVRSEIKIAARELTQSSGKILIVSNPTLNGALSIAALEAAFLDEGLPYRRRFTFDEPDSSPFVRIYDGDNSEDFSNSLDGYCIRPITVEGLKGRFGDPRNGPLTSVAQAHSLAQEISPFSSRLRQMRPWMLSGNWIQGALDTTYDSVFSSIRDYLSSEGSIRVVPVTEVPIPAIENYPWLNGEKLQLATLSWESVDVSEREKVMQELAFPALKEKSLSTTKIEELLWHCILGSNWKSDLASQIFYASLLWKKMSPKEASSVVSDTLLAHGELSSLKP